MGMFTELIEVACAANGMPLRVRWQGQDYRLAAEPQRWFERRKWWDENLRIPRGIGAGIADYEMWRLQLVAVRGPRQVHSVDVSFDAQTERWRLVRVHESLARSA